MGRIQGIGPIMSETAEKSYFLQSGGHFWLFQLTHKSGFVEYSTEVEISTVEFSENKLVMCLYIHHKYIGLVSITFEGMKKVKTFC